MEENPQQTNSPVPAGQDGNYNWLALYFLLLAFLSGLFVLGFREKWIPVSGTVLFLASAGPFLVRQIPAPLRDSKSLFAVLLLLGTTSLFQTTGFYLVLLLVADNHSLSFGQWAGRLLWLVLTYGIPFIIIWNRAQAGTPESVTGFRKLPILATDNPWLFGLFAGVPSLLLINGMRHPDRLELIFIQTAGLTIILMILYFLLPAYVTRPPRNSRWHSHIWFFWILLTSIKADQDWRMNAIMGGIVLLVIGIVSEVDRQTDRSRPWQRPFQELL